MVVTVVDESSDVSVICPYLDAKYQTKNREKFHQCRLVTSSYAANAFETEKTAVLYVYML